MIASLPMYDRPETASTNDKLWGLVRERLGYGPDQLTRGGELWDHWGDPDLVLSQTCGMPYRTRLDSKIALVATPVHGLHDLSDGHYRSVLVARRDDPRTDLKDFEGASLAYNSKISQSGWAAPLNYAAETGLTFSVGPKTGGHAASARTVVQGKADLSALDAVSWEMMMRWDSFAGDLKVVDVTPETPSLPFITSLARDAGQMRRALEAAISALSPDERELLCLRGLVWIAPKKYLKVPNPALPAA